MATDPLTNLAKIPEGYRWKIRKDRFMGGTWIVILLQKKAGRFWRTVRSGSTSIPSYATRESENVQYLYFNKGSIKDKERARLREASAVYGTYPPKKLGDSA